MTRASPRKHRRRGQGGAPLAEGTRESCTVARGVPGVLRVGVVPMLPVSMHQGLRGAEGVFVRWGWLGMMSHRKFPSFCIARRPSHRRLRTCR